MGQKSETLAGQSPPPHSPDPTSDSIDPILHIFRFLPYSFLRLPRLRLKLPTLTLPSAMTVYALILLTYFMVVSGIVYDVIVEPPGIGSTQDRATGAVRPVVFLPGRVNGQYIIEGLSSGFMFVLGGPWYIDLVHVLSSMRVEAWWFMVLALMVCDFEIHI
ncbi:hypothetical protein Dimus_025660 [Dionaea muscipula]